MSLSAPAQQVQINNFGTAVASSALTATSAGSLIVAIFVNQLASGNATSVTDNIGNTYSLGIGNTGTSQRHIEIWYCLSATAGVTAVTVNNTAGTNVAGTVLEFTGGASGTRTPAGLANASSTNPPAATVTPAVGDVVIGALGYLAAVASTRQETLADVSYTALTAVTRGTTTMYAGAWKSATSTTATGPLWTMSPAVTTGAATIAFIPPVTNVNAPPTSASGSAPAPTVSGASSVAGGGAASASGSAPAPVVTGESTISGGGAASASGSAVAPVVAGGTDPVSGGATTPATAGSGSAVPPVIVGQQVPTVLAAPSTASGSPTGPVVTAVQVLPSYLYTPPQWWAVQQLSGSLRFRVPVSTTTYKLGGVWYNVQSPGVGVTDNATYVFRTPTLVTADIALELQAFGVGTITTF